MESGMGFRLDLYHFIYHQIILSIFLLLHLLQPVITFNLDTKSPIIFSGTKNTYFGYSVGLQANSGRSRVLIGAPKEPQLRGIYNFYQCEINQKTCNTIITSRGSAGNDNHWLGVTVDTNPKQDNNFIVCSHRNITTKFDQHGGYNVQSGSCFEILGTDIIVTTNPGEGASTGISAHYSQDGNTIIIGTPTLSKKASGGYILKHSHLSATQPIAMASLNPTYAGYAVNMVDNQIIVGIPRYENYGAIRIEDELITAPQNKFTFGSYFGSAIAAGDVNGDGRKDVIVGAPFYSEKYPEEGRVYIFHAVGEINHTTFSKTANEILSVPAYRSHFGTSLAVDDFNKDSFADILVGSPYENNGIGCIYLFNSYNNILEKTPSQKIEGTKINNKLKSFGISFSRTVDIDKNGYPDIAVGAYLSDQAIVLQGRPVVKLHATLFAKPKILQSFLDPIWQTNEDIIVNVTLYMYFEIQYHLVMNTTLKADIGQPASRKRVYLENNLKEYTSSSDVMGSNLFQKVYQVKIKNKINVQDPIKFSLDYHLPNNGYRASCKLCPLLKSGNLSTEIEFDLLCGKDKICKTYFNLELSSPSSGLLLSGERKYITIDVKVENMEEHAYNTKAHIHFPSWLEYVTVRKYNNSINNVTCSIESNQHKLTCFLGYPMREKSSTSFLLTFIANWMPIPKDVEVTMSVTTDSVVPKEYLNKTVALTIPVKKKSVLKLFGISETDLHIHKSSNDRIAVISHAFILENTGPSEAQNLIFQTSVPHLIIRNMTIMTLDSMQYDDQNSSDVCTTTTKDYSEDNLQKIKKYILKAVNYDCSWMNCINVTCNFKELKKYRSKKIQINIAIENIYLDELKGKMLNIYINTTGLLNQKSKDYIIKVPGVEKTITTRVYIQPLKPTLKWWVPAASILSGILLMVLVSILLHEVGFFTRYQTLVEEKESLNPDENENKQETEGNEIDNNIKKEGD